VRKRNLMATLVSLVLALIAAPGTALGSSIETNTRVLHMVFSGKMDSLQATRGWPATGGSGQFSLTAHPTVCTLVSSSGTPIGSCDWLQVSGNWSNVTCGVGDETGDGTIDTTLGPIEVSYESDWSGGALNITIWNASMTGYPTGGGGGGGTLSSVRWGAAECWGPENEWDVNGDVTITLNGSAVSTP
jgi:hypothetical protein